MSHLFSELLEKAREQKQLQRILFLFAKINEEQKGEEASKGSIEPVMCVDKLPSELVSFNQFIGEADAITPDWDFVLIACLSGQSHTPPSSEEAEPFLNRMANDVASGQDLSSYVIFDRQQNPIEMEVC